MSNRKIKKTEFDIGFKIALSRKIACVKYPGNAYRFNVSRTVIGGKRAT